VSTAPVPAVSPTPEPPLVPSQPPPKFGITYAPLVIDLIARFGLLRSYRLGLLNSWAFWAGHVVLGLAVVLWLVQRDERLTKKYNLGSKSVVPADAPGWILLTCALCIHGYYQTWNVQAEAGFWNALLVTAIAGSINVLYVVMVAVGSASDRGVNLPQAGRPDEPVADQNDRVLIHLQTELTSRERTVDAYTIESTLIGALTFSAFVTVVSSDKGSLGGVAHFLDDAHVAVASAVSLQTSTMREALLHATQEDSLLAAIACLSLMCSMFFLAVIVARLRFNTLVGEAECAVQVAASFNAKEDQLHHDIFLEDKRAAKYQERLDVLQADIKEALDIATEESRRLQPVLAYMTLFRHLGVLTFLFLLITSAAWISPLLAILFTMIGGLACFYPWLDGVMRGAGSKRISLIRLRELLPGSK
jgi:hypothetical protein